MILSLLLLFFDQLLLLLRGEPLVLVIGLILVLLISPFGFVLAFKYFIQVGRPLARQDLHLFVGLLVVLQFSRVWSVFATRKEDLGRAHHLLLLLLRLVLLLLVLVLELKETCAWLDVLIVVLLSWTRSGLVYLLLSPLESSH